MKIEKIFQTYVVLVMSLLPLWFLPRILDSFGLGKQVIMVGAGLVGLVLWLGVFLLKKDWKIVWSGWMTWLLLTVAVAIWGWTTLPVGVGERSVLLPWGITSLVTVVVWMFLLLQAGSRELVAKLTTGWSVVAVVFLVLNLFLFLWPESRLPVNLPTSNPIVSLSMTFSPTGSLMTEVIWLGLLLVLNIKFLQNKIKNRENYLLHAVFVAIVAVAEGLVIYRMSKVGIINMDWASSWAVMVEAFKQKTLLGVGIGNFTEAFYKFRTNGYNLTANWSGVFGYTMFGWMQWWTELGVLGMILVLVSGWMVFFRGDRKKVNYCLRGLCWLLMWFTPVTLVNMLVMMGVLVLLDKDRSMEIKAYMAAGEKQTNVVPLFVVMGIVAMVGWSGWRMAKPVLAAFKFYESNQLAGKNDGVGTYNAQVKVLELEPNWAEYRRAYSQTNLALAVSLLGSKKAEEFSDQEKSQISTLYQQAVREAKSAVALEPNNPVYWSNLGSIYRTMVGLVEGAPDWATASYQQAVFLDQVNPLAKMDLGAMYYATGQYEAADRVFEETVRVKPDLANAWYNWAYAKKNLAGRDPNKLATAIAYLDQAVKLVPTSSGDYEKAAKELETWKEEYNKIVKSLQAQVSPTPTPKAPESLSVPEVIKPNTEEKVNVPAAELEPPKP